MLRDGVGALIAERVQLLDQRLTLDPLTLGNAASQLANAEWRQQPLRRRARRGDQQLRLVALRLQRAQGRQSLGHDAQCRRRAVVREAVPTGQGQHLDLRSEQRHGLGQRAHGCFVGDDGDRPGATAGSMRGAGEVRGKPRQEPRRHAGKRQRFAGAKDPLQWLVHRATRM